MILKNDTFDGLAKYLCENSKKIIVYGAGMIGEIIVPYILNKYELISNVEYYVDRDNVKQEKGIKIYNRNIQIKSLQYLIENIQDEVLIISNSKFYDVVDSLDKIKKLDDIEAYIIPVMQLNDYMYDDFNNISISNESQIPKVINYCWFGNNKLPDNLKRCIDSWYKWCPDYQITLWNEENFDINKHKYIKQAYEKGKYSFASDMARFYILYENGGIYLDTDVFMLKNFDDLLYQQGFIATEKWGNVNSGGGCGFISKHPMVKEIIEYRKHFSFINSDGTMNIETNGVYETKIFMKYGYKPVNSIQRVNNVTVYPSCVFHPYDYVSQNNDIKDITHSVHMFDGGWMSDDDRINRKCTQNKYKSLINRMNNVKF